MSDDVDAEQAVSPVPTITIEIHPDRDVVELHNWTPISMARIDRALRSVEKRIMQFRASAIHEARVSAHRQMKENENVAA